MVLGFPVEQRTSARTIVLVILSFMESEISTVKNFILLEFLRGYENLEHLLANYTIRFRLRLGH